MLKTIIMNNFRTWSHAEIHLCRGINIFIGNSAQGKTNINRALDLVINNRPLGNSFRSHWAKKRETVRGKSCQTKVEIHTFDDHSVARIKSKTENHYVINGEKLIIDPETLREVHNILRINPINTQFQLDPPFLLGESPPVVARYLNSIAHLDDIDISYSNIRTLRTQIKTDLNKNKKDISRLQKKLSEFERLDEAEKKLEKLESTLEALNRLENRCESLSSIIRLIKENEQKMSQFSVNLDGFYKDTEILLEDSVKLYSEIETLENRSEELWNLINGIESTEKALQKIPSNIQSRMDNLNRTENELENIINLEKKRNDLSVLIETVLKTQEQIDIKSNKIKDLQKEIDFLLPKTCPIYEQACPLYKNIEK